MRGATPPSIKAKMLLVEEMKRQGIRQADLARLMGIKPQEVTRLVDMSHTTRIDTIEQALRALGRKLEMRLVA